MKILLQIFYDILLKIKTLKVKKKDIISKSILKNYLQSKSDHQEVLIDDLANYFQNFYDFCFELQSDNMLKGQINFKY